MTTATLERIETQPRSNKDRVIIQPNGDFTNFHYVTPEELDMYMKMFYSP